MESNFTIHLPDNKIIYGVKHTTNQQSKLVVVIVHGLLGSMNQYALLTCARRMSEEGINVIRFNQYDERPSGRVFHDTTISQHVDDTRQVMNYAREAGFTNVVLAGHSLGGPVTIQAADPDTAGILLWDPTGTPKERASYWEHRDPSSGLAFLKVQMNVLIGEDWLKDAQSFPSTYQTFSNLKMPFKIIAAESGDKLDYCYQYLNARNGDGDFSIINQADHAFTVSGTAEELASESIMWLQDY